MTTFIYALCEPGTRTVRYIGMTKNIKERLCGHLEGSSKKPTPLGEWLRSLISKGEKPNMITLSKVTREEGSEEEIRYIKNARMLGMDLVNSTDGGAGCTNPTPETREKMRVNNLGEKNNMFGKPVPQERKDRIGEAQTGEKNHRFGKPFTPEQRAARSAALSGEKNPMFGRTGAQAPAFGRVVLPGTREKLSEALTGRVISEGHREKISKAMTGRPSPKKGKPSGLKGRPWSAARRTAHEKSKEKA